MMLHGSFFPIFKSWLSLCRSLVSEHSSKLFIISFDLIDLYFKAKTVCFQELEAFSKIQNVFNTPVKVQGNLGHKKN